MLRLKLSVIFILILFTGNQVYAGGGREDGGSQAQGKPVIAVSILPQTYFIQRIGEDRVSTVLLVGPGQSPHSYEPTPGQMEKLSKADAWILSKTDFEITLKPKIASLYPALKMIDGTSGVSYRKMEEHSHDDEDDEDHDDDSHDDDANIDRHTWLGREPAKIMAAHIRDTLAEIDPVNASFYDANYSSLISDIDQVFNQLARELEPLKGREVFVYHPAFGYFFDEFGIIQEAVETGGKEPSTRALAELIEKAKAEKIKVIFLQAQFPANAAKSVADSAGAEVVTLDPLAPDWLDNIKKMGNALKKAAVTVK